ncbi:MAG: dihydropteroate synthase [Phycisphaerae bacterium]|nr:dihydropteroate synthase [Phycisphaerae bacterium]
MAITLDDILNSNRTHRSVVMGILNVTPDSFSDGGGFLEPSIAVAQAQDMLREGASIIDVGAESTQPGSERVSADEQIARLEKILPQVVKLANDAEAFVSIDTTLAKVAAFALDAGAAIVNDVSAGRDDPELLPLVAERNAAVVLMHMLGEPKTMQANPTYQDVVAEVSVFLSKRLAAAEAAGIARRKCIIDPGIGFGKTLQHNLLLLAGIAPLTKLGCPVLIGPSRKRFIGVITGQEDSTHRLGGTVAACLRAFEGGATIFRVHDVGQVRDALLVAGAIDNATPSER